MKTIIITTAISAAILGLVAAPAAVAEQPGGGPDWRQQGRNDQEHGQRGGDWQGRDHEDHGEHRGWGQDRGADHHWRRGERMGYNDWNRAERVDYRRYHLRQPPRGYEWRRQNGQFVLGAIATGLVASIILNAGR